MQRPKPSSSLPRKAARQMILNTANAGRSLDLAPLAMRHLHLAVFKCRQRALLDASIFRAAGFRPRKRV